MTLDEYKFRNKLTNQDIAKSLNCSVTYVIFLRQGKCKPSKNMMQKIMNFTSNKVQPNDFYKENQNDS